MYQRILGLILLTLVGVLFWIGPDWTSMKDLENEKYNLPVLRINGMHQIFQYSDFDPVRIERSFQYGIIKNILATLVRLDNNGDLVSDLASEFYWQGNDLHFKIRDDFHTIDGLIFSPKDVVFSLKRPRRKPRLYGMELRGEKRQPQPQAGS